MKIITTGLLVFLAWSAASTYVYVCKIKDLCADKVQPTEVVAKTPLPEKIPEKVVEKPSIVVPDSLIIHFGYNESIFVPNGGVTNYTSIAKKYMEQEKDKTMYITGNTDAIGSVTFNKELGMKRARNVKSFFVESGIDQNRIVLQSNSKSNPVASNETESGRAENRRAKIDIK